MTISQAIFDEMSKAASNVRNVHFERLKQLGVQPMAIGQIGAMWQHSIGVDHIRVGADGLFEPDPDGQPACLIAVRDPGADWVNEGYFDIVAFNSTEPARWWCRTGLAFALGEHLLEYPDTVNVVRTPCDWLASAGSGLCILDWSERSPAWRELPSGPILKFRDELLRQKVRNAIVGAAPMPRMEIAA